MDTVILKIYGPRKFQFKKKHLFCPEIESRQYHQLSETEKQTRRYYLRKFVLKAPLQDNYVPVIDVLETLDKDNKQVIYILIVQFSLPKLLYGNSLREVSDGDYAKSVVGLQRVLENLGILVEKDVLANARVTGLHFCKNVVLPKDVRLQDILAELERVDISKVVDVTKKETKNGGQVLHIYSGNTERVFYDKVVDAMRPKNKRKDKGLVDYERTIIDEYDLHNTEVFRYEYRLKRAPRVEKDVNETLGKKPRTHVLFKDIFTDNLCRDVLIKSWRDLVQRPENQLALIGPTDNFKLLLKIVEGSKKKGGPHSLNRALTAFGIVCIIKTHGVKELRKTIFRYWLKDHPERLTQKIQEASELTKGLPYSNGIAFIDSGIEKYELITRSLLAKVRYNE